MRSALLGDHPDGLAAARALAASGRHDLVVYSGPVEGRLLLERWNLQPGLMGDLEEILADPAVEAVIVAGSAASRAGQLRRALQSERHVLCVHPVDPSADVAYEASLLQAEMGVALLPLLPEVYHPAVQRLKNLLRYEALPARSTPPPLPPLDKDKVMVRRVAPSTAVVEAAVEPHAALPSLAGGLRVLEVRRWAEEEVLLDVGGPERPASVPGWDALRFLGGEIAELMALSPSIELEPGQPLVVQGRFVQGGLFQATLLPDQAEARYQLTLIFRGGRADLEFAQGFPGLARLTWIDDLGEAHEESWPALDPWEALIREFEQTVNGLGRRPETAPGTAVKTSWTSTPPRLGWQDALRALELDDAVRRSVTRRRASTMDFQELAEEASFKGAMTLVGCSLVWISLMLLVLSAWVPWLGWFILPVFGLFLVLQGLRWVVPEKSSPDAKTLQQGHGNPVRTKQD